MDQDNLSFPKKLWLKILPFIFCIAVAIGIISLKFYLQDRDYEKLHPYEVTIINQTKEKIGLFEFTDEQGKTLFSFSNYSTSKETRLILPKGIEKPLTLICYNSAGEAVQKSRVPNPKPGKEVKLYIK